MKTFWTAIIVVVCLVAGCTPQAGMDGVNGEKGEKGDPGEPGVCNCPEPPKMEDLDFFGTYYSSCVEYITELREVYVACDDTTTIPDVETCVWTLWNNGEANGSASSGCVRKLREVAELKMLPQADWCDRLVPERMQCEHGIRP